MSWTGRYKNSVFGLLNVVLVRYVLFFVANFNTGSLEEISGEG